MFNAYIAKNYLPDKNQYTVYNSNFKFEYLKYFINYVKLVTSAKGVDHLKQKIIETIYAFQMLKHMVNFVVTYMMYIPEAGEILQDSVSASEKTLLYGIFFSLLVMNGQITFDHTKLNPLISWKIL
jgi:hypothetical protein